MSVIRKTTRSPVRGAADSPLGARLWTPEQITTQAWFDAADVATITEAGGNVSQWDDKSGNGLHAKQGTGASQPDTGAAINGLNAISFDGSDDFMQTDSNPFGASVVDALVMFVHKPNTINAGTLFSLTGSVNNSNRWQAHCPWSNGQFYFDCGGTGGANRVQEPYGVSAGESVLASCYGSDTEELQQIHKNGTLLDGDSTGHTVSTVGNIIIGAADPGDQEQDVTIGELVIINGTVTTETRQLIEGYLAWKWGLNGSLPSIHPFKNNPPTIEA